MIRKRMISYRRRPLGLLVILLALLPSGRAATNAVRITDTGDKVRIEIHGDLFSEYYYKEVPRPFFYPINGPDGIPMTRNYPMKEVAGEERDHVHHRSLWWTHGDINGVDFWAEGQKAGKVVHKRFGGFKSGNDFGMFRAHNDYVAPDGRVVATDERLFIIYNRPSKERVFDYQITLRAPSGELALGDTKEGSMAIRVAESMRVIKDKKPGDGHIVNSEGAQDGSAWGKRAKWCDYYGPVNGQVLGVAIFDHPENPRHPTWWHVRDYGLFAANPFGIHDFEKQPADTGKLVIPAGKTVTFRYRFYLHKGNEKEAQVAKEYEAYVQPPSTSR